MYNSLSQRTIDIIESESRCFRALMDFGTFQIASDKIYNFETDGASCSEEDIAIGGIFSQGVTIEVSEVPCSLEGKSFFLYLYLAEFLYDPTTHEDLAGFTHAQLSTYTHEELRYMSGEAERIPIGKYRVGKCKSKANGFTVSASDFLAEADKEYDSKLSFPVSSKDIEEEICNALGIQSVARKNDRYLTSDGDVYITSDSDEYILYDYYEMIRSKPQNTTMRQMLGYIASLRGCFAISNRLGELNYTWYKDSGYELKDNRIDIPEVEENDIDIGQIRCEIAENQYLHWGGSDQTMNIVNPYMTRKNLKGISRKMLPFTYRPALVNQRLGDPRIDVWDILHLGSYLIPVMSLSYHFDGGLSAEIEATGKTDTESNI